MNIYPENKYAIEIAENPHSNTFSIWFKNKPEDLVFHLLRAIGFRNRAYGKEFYHSNDVNARLFAEELQQTLRQGCFPEVIPYISSYEQNESSITTNKFSIATIYYTNDEQKTVQQEFLMFENSRLIRESFAWLIGYLNFGSSFKRVKTSEKVRKSDALRMFHDGNMKTKLPVPFGSGCDNEFSQTKNNSVNSDQEETKTENIKITEEGKEVEKGKVEENSNEVQMEEKEPEIPFEADNKLQTNINSEEEIVEQENLVKKEEKDEVKYLPEPITEVGKEAVLQTLENREIEGLPELSIDGIEVGKEDEKEELLTDSFLQVPKDVIEDKLQAFDHKGKPVKVRQLKGFKLKLKKNSSPKVLLKSITITESDQGKESNKFSFDNWTSSSQFLVEWEVENEDPEKKLEVVILWKNGFSFKLNISPKDLLPFSETFRELMGMIVYEKVVYQLHKTKGLIGRREQGSHTEINSIQNVVDSVDFGFDTETFPRDLSPKIPVGIIEIKTGQAKEIGDDGIESWRHFEKASKSLEFAGTLIGIEKEIKIKIWWASGKSIELALAPIDIPTTVTPEFWKELIQSRLNCSTSDCHQTEDEQATIPLKQYSGKANVFVQLEDLIEDCKHIGYNSYVKPSLIYRRDCLKYRLTYLFRQLTIKQKTSFFNKMRFEYRCLDYIPRLLELKTKTPAQKFRFQKFSETAFKGILNVTYGNMEHDPKHFMDIYLRLSTINCDINCIAEILPCESTEVEKIRKEEEDLLNKCIADRKIEELIDEKRISKKEFSFDDRIILKDYLAAQSISTCVFRENNLFNYFTPDEIVVRMWRLAFKHGYERGTVLEPSAGIGKFLQFAPRNIEITAHETDSYAATICKALNPQATVKCSNFQNLFTGDIFRRRFRNKLEIYDLPKFDLIIGSPPFISLCYKRKSISNEKNRYVECVHYFIKNGLDLLEKDGLMIFLIPYFFMKDNEHNRKIKKKIAKKSKLLAIYRLPEGVIPGLEVNMDIVIYKKLTSY